MVESRRTALLGLCLTGLAACAEAPPERPSLSLAVQTAGPHPAAIEIWARDALPVTAATLLAPDGRQSVATTLESTLPDQRYGGGRPDVGVGVAGGSSGSVGAGISIGVPLFLGSRSGPTLIVSRAVIPLADPADFRARWESYRVRLVYGTPGRNSREEILPAPAPRPN